MDENLSWRAKLAKSNINILNIDEDRWYYEFMYRPRPGQVKWSKTFYEPKVGSWRIDMDKKEFVECEPEYSPSIIAAKILEEVLKLRKELEG